MELIQSKAAEVLLTLALAVISLLGAYGIFYIQKAADKLRAQTQKLGDDKQRQLLVNALDDVENLAAVTVGALEQTTAKALREGVKAGVNSREELFALGERAFDDIRDRVGPEARRVITENLGSFDKYLSHLIEMKVLELKTATGRQ